MASTKLLLLIRLFFALIILLIALNISLFNNIDYFSIFTFKPFSYYFPNSFHEKQNHPSNFSIPCKASNNHKQNIEDSSSNITSRAIHIDASNCSLADLNATTKANCCPPLPSPFKFIDFKDLPSSNNTPLRVRKPSHLLDEEFIAKFEKGISLMKALPNDDPRSFHQQSQIHCAYCNGAYRQQHPFEDDHHKLDVHRSWLFFPFHRWYLYFFERILGNLLGDPSFAIPFWNWDSIQGMTIPSYFSNPNSSLYDELRNKNHTSPHNIVDFNYNGNDSFVPCEQQISFNLAIMYKNMVLTSIKECFMGHPLRLGDESDPGKGSLEIAPHNTVHAWVGDADTPNHEDMGTFYSAARDPIFYTHHCNVDRLWVIWKTLGGKEGRRDYSDDDDWLDTDFFFHDENANLVRVKIRDCIDTKKLGYVYQDVHLPWLNSQPTSPRLSKQQRVAKKAKFLGSKLVTFPLVLDSKITTIVNRPNKLRCEREKEQEEEVLVIEGIEFGSDVYVKFDVHIDDYEDKLSGPDEIEFVGSFVSLQHGHRDKVNTRFKVGISKVLEILEADEDDYLVVTLVPRAGKVTIGSIKIEFIPK